jgi:hypothetical protein
MSVRVTETATVLALGRLDFAALIAGQHPSAFRLKRRLVRPIPGAEALTIVRARRHAPSLSNAGVRRPRTAWLCSGQAGATAAVPFRIRATP